MRTWLQRHAAPLTYYLLPGVIGLSLTFVLIGGMKGLAGSAGEEAASERSSVERAFGEDSSPKLTQERGRTGLPDTASSPSSSWTPATPWPAYSTGLRPVGNWGDFTFAVAAGGETLYVGNSGWLDIVDISTPERPVCKGRVGVSLAEDIALTEKYAYVVSNGTTVAGDTRGHYGLRVADISDPANPREVGALNTAGVAWSVAVAGSGYVYVADGGGMRIIDVSDPTRPKEIGALGHDATAVEVRGIRAYLADGCGLRVLSIADPAAPQPLGVFKVDDCISDLTVAGDFAYLAVNDIRRAGDPDGVNQGLRVVDISDPTAPELVAAYDTRGRISGVAVSDGYAYITYRDLWDEPERLLALNVADPAQPKPLDVLVLDDILGTDVVGNEVTVTGLTAAGDYVYIAGWHAGMVVVRRPEAGAQGEARL